MKRTPNHEVPGSTVPETRNQENQPEVKIQPPDRHPVTTQRNVKVIAHPAPQRNMPATPELTDILRNIRIIKILQKVKTDHPAKPDGHIGITGKIVIDLEGIGQHPHPGGSGGHARRIHGKNGISILAQYIGDQYLLAQTQGKPEKTGQAVVRIFVGTPVFKLIGNFIETHNGAGNQLGKHKDVEGKIADLFQRDMHLAIDIHRVSHFLETEKRNAYRQRHLCPFNRLAAKTFHHQVEILYKEIGIFEIEQHTDVQHNRKCHQ